MGFPPLDKQYMTQGIHDYVVKLNANSAAQQISALLTAAVTSANIANVVGCQILSQFETTASALQNHTSLMFGPSSTSLPGPISTGGAFDFKAINGVKNWIKRQTGTGNAPFALHVWYIREVW